MVSSATSQQVKALQSIASDIPEAQDLFEVLASRVRGRYDFGYKRTMRVLREHGTKISKEQFETICNRLQMAGVGKVIRGDDGNDHFEVFYHLISIARAAKGEVRELDPAPDKKSTLPEFVVMRDLGQVESPAPAPQVAVARASAAKSMKVKYGNFEMELPLNMDDEEKERAAQLIAALPQLVK